jgi:hypothetical protein
MKHRFLIVILALFFIACGGDDGAGPGDGGGNNNSTDPTPTTPGTPDGAPTTQSIGPGGGTITSSDGLFSVTIPPGALASAAASSPALETEITIQPITNTAWGGVGAGYRLLPDGLPFAVPVELNFALEDSLLWGSDTSFVDVARQTDEGTWGILKSRNIDWESRTLTCTTSHFSDYSMVEGMQIRPAATSIGTSKTADLTVRFCMMGGTPADAELVTWVINCSDDDDLVPLGTFSDWSVNGITGGNSTVGTVVKTEPNASAARYTAPATAPQQNPVAVSVRAKDRRGGTQLLVSNITIGATWYGTVTITQGTYSSEAEVIWTAVARYQNLETYSPSGTVHYTPETDYGPVCDFVSMDPLDGVIDPSVGVLFIDWNNSPAKAFGYGSMNTIATTCFICDGWTAPDCSESALPVWFQADSLAVSPAGDAIYWEFTNNGQDPPVHTIVDFKQGLPPVSFAAKR